MKQYLNLIILGGFFVFISWIGVIAGLQNLVAQYDAQSFPHITGNVLSSRVVAYAGSKGSTHYRASINYSYPVNGRDYYSGRYRYDNHPTGAAAVRALVSAHPEGSLVEVYYNPQEPGDAVLSPGVDDRDVFQLFFFTAASLMALWLLLRVGWQNGWPWDAARPAGGVTLITENMVTRARLPRYQPPGVVIAILGILFVAAALVMISGLIQEPSLVAGGWLLTGILTIGGMIGLWIFQKIHSGTLDLVIDEGSRTFQLPHTFKRIEQRRRSFSEVKTVYLKPVKHRTRYGFYYSYLVELELAGDSLQPLIELNETRANSFAAWLREKYHLSAAIAVGPREP